jgi:lipid II isoglutaminyl synthase (glutamine-hydrolysing)
MKLRIAHLYPREMNLYGDSGNVMVLRRRLLWRGHSCEILPVEVGRPFAFDGVDIVVGGGGPDSGQRHVCTDLVTRSNELHAAVGQGVPMLLVCGTFQLFGRSVTTRAGDLLPGIGIFDATTVAGPSRITGDIVVRSACGLLRGYENHSGRTRLGPGQQPFGVVEQGTGNATGSRTEGAVAKAAVGTYLHGPVLPRNPALADRLLLDAMLRHDPGAELEPLPDEQHGDPQPGEVQRAARSRRARHIGAR